MNRQSIPYPLIMMFLAMGTVVLHAQNVPPKRAEVREGRAVRSVQQPGDVRRPVRRTPVQPAKRLEPTSSSPQTVTLEIGQGERVWGDVVIELDREAAPQTVRNFLYYVDRGFYDGTVFHRVLPHFMVQGGGYEDIDEGPKSGLRGPIRNEGKTGLKNERGTIAMARGRNPHSAQAQFFINLVNNPGLDAENPRGDGYGFCAFGRVVDGMRILDRIARAPRKHNVALNGDKAPSQPIRPVVILRAYREDDASEDADVDDAAEAGRGASAVNPEEPRTHRGRPIAPKSEDPDAPENIEEPEEEPVLDPEDEIPDDFEADPDDPRAMPPDPAEPPVDPDDGES